MIIRRATVADVPAMGRIINDCAELGQMLPKSQAVLYENIRAFHVAEMERPVVCEEGDTDSDNPRRAAELASHGLDDRHEADTRDPALETRSVIVGVCGLSVVWANLAECASLAVDPEYRGHGIGRKLVEVCLQDARDLGIRKVMTLTYEQAFFERCGFSVIDRMQLPLKVWSECVRCPKKQACDEIAMVREFEDVPEVAGMKPPPKPLDYEVPVVLTTKGRAPGQGT
ncbi:MAG: GNAT family N-acetyltransferase [Planctomycetota bacterium]